MLLVEDNEGVRKLFRTALETEGYAVLEARSGELAVSLIEAAAEPVDVLVADVVLPRMTGYELAQWTRSMHPAAKIVYMSGYPQNDVLNRARANRSAAFMQKPFAPAELVARIRQVLSRGSPSTGV